MAVTTVVLLPVVTEAIAILMVVTPFLFIPVMSPANAPLMAVTMVVLVPVVTEATAILVAVTMVVTTVAANVAAMVPVIMIVVPTALSLEVAAAAPVAGMAVIAPAPVSSHILVPEARRQCTDVRWVPGPIVIRTDLPTVTLVAIEPSHVEEVVGTIGAGPGTQAPVVDEIDARAVLPAVAVSRGPGWRPLPEDLVLVEIERLGAIGQGARRNEHDKGGAQRNRKDPLTCFPRRTHLQPLFLISG